MSFFGGGSGGLSIELQHPRPFLLLTGTFTLGVFGRKVFNVYSLVLYP